FAVEQPDPIAALVRDIGQDLAAHRGGDLLEVFGALYVTNDIALFVAPALQRLAGVGPAFRAPRLLDRPLPRGAVAQRLEHRSLLEQARKDVVLVEAGIGEVGGARGRGAFDAG